MRRLVLAAVAVAVAALVWWRLASESGPANGGMLTATDRTGESASPRAQEPTASRRVRGRLGVPDLPRRRAPGPASNLDQRDVIDGDELWERDVEAHIDINTSMRELMPAMRTCVDKLISELKEPLDVRFTVVLDVFAVANDVGEEEGHIADVTSVEWPPQFSAEMRECWVTAIKEYRFPASHEYAYRYAHAIRLHLDPPER